MSSWFWSSQGKSNQVGRRRLCRRWWLFRACMVSGLLAVHAAGAAGIDEKEGAWKTGDGYRWREVHPVAGTGAGFKLRDAAAHGLSYTNWLDMERSLTNSPVNNGSGVAVGDVNGDDLPDIYFAGLTSDNALFLNRGGWRFERDNQPAIACPGQVSTGVAFADVDGDGDLDLLVNSLEKGTRLFLNDGGGQIAEGTKAAGLESESAAMAVALGDVDLDGDLDLYVTHTRREIFMDQPDTRFAMEYVNGKPRIARVNGRPVTASDLVGRFEIGPHGGPRENGQMDAFYRNLGGGKFERVRWGDVFLTAEGAPAEPNRGWGLGVLIRDLTGDGLPDIYVCNDSFTEDDFWVNDGGGKFKQAPSLALRHFALSSMGVDAADVNRDGIDDFVVLDMLSRGHSQRLTQLEGISPPYLGVGEIATQPQYPRNMLYLGRGDGTFDEVAMLAGLEGSEWSWTPLFLDVDLDGYEDLLVSNGFVRDVRDRDVSKQISSMQANRQLTVRQQLMLRRLYPEYPSRNLIFRNQGDLTFSEVSLEWGLAGEDITTGLAVGDFDGDGDLDLVLNRVNAGAGLYENTASGGRIGVRVGQRNGQWTHANARIRVTGGAVESQVQEWVEGGRYLSDDDGMRVFATGAAKTVRVEVRWPDGRRLEVPEAVSNAIYEIWRGRSSPAGVEKKDGGEKSQPLFEDVSESLGHRHVEPTFIDYERQPLLPHRLSQSGPGVGWVDFDQDGWEDLVIGTGRGGSPGMFINDRKGGWTQPGDWMRSKLLRDTSGLSIWSRGQGLDLLMGLSNYEDGQPAGPALLLYDLQAGRIEQAVPAGLGAAGPVCVADVDLDGDLDVFLGSRAVGGAYPTPAPFALYLQEGGALMAAPREVIEGGGEGLVAAALFADLDGDADPELVLACDWGPIRVFRNDGGRFREVTDAWGFGEALGWWTGLAVIDADGDGLLDLVAGNWGRNSSYFTTEDRYHLFYGDMDGNGVVDLVEAYEDEETGAMVAAQPLSQMARSVPSIVQPIGTHRAYAEASVETIFGEAWAKMDQLTVNTFETSIWMNRGGRFERHALPLEAQFAPVFGISPADYNGDGHDDLFLSQNFFAVFPGIVRMDSGRGLLLLGDGQGGFKPVPGQKSGLLIYGEQRGSAAADYDRDGRVDLVVAQNGAATKLYRNRGGQEGLSIRLEAGKKNPAGIGAQVRVFQGGKGGPVREIQGGSGYWSQPSTGLVFGGLEGQVDVWVRWPGGEEQWVRDVAGEEELVVRR